MTLPIAIRARIDFSEPPRRARAIRMPRLAGPIFAYWGAMGLLAYGVTSGALPLDEWLWPEPREPAVLEPPETPEMLEEEGAAPDVAAPPGRVTPFPAEPPVARTEPSAPPSEDAPVAEIAPLAAAPPLPALEGAPAGRSPSNEPRRLTLSLHPPAPSYAESPAHDDAPARLDGATARLDGVPPRRSEMAPSRASEPAPSVRFATRAAPEGPASHLEWTQPGWGASRGREDGRLRLVSPDRARGSRHVEDDAFLFPGEDPPSASRAPRASVAAVTPSFERERDADPALPAPEKRRAAANVGSCEAAAAAANDEMDLTRSRSGPADVTRDAYASILDNGRYLTGCRIPNHVRFEICAAVKDGRAVGVTVTTTPRDAGVAGCVRAAVTRLSFPVSPRLDVTRTRFDAAR